MENFMNHTHFLKSRSRENFTEMDRKILIPGDVPKQALLNKPERKILNFTKTRLRRKISSEDFIQIGNAVLQISLFAFLVLLLVVFSQFNSQNEFKTEDHAEAIEKIQENKPGICGTDEQFKNLRPCNRRDYLGIINDHDHDRDHSDDLKYGPVHQRES